MRKSFLRFVFGFAALAIIAVTVPSCKSGPKDADLEKIVSEKAAALSTDATGLAGTVKDGVVTLTGSFKDDMTKTAFTATVKEIPGVKSVVDNTTVAPPPAPTPVVSAPTINGDDALKTGVVDATKDFPGVKTEVKDSVIILTGEIKRASLSKLMAALHSLKPKKVENKLTIK